MLNFLELFCLFTKAARLHTGILIGRCKNSLLGFYSSSSSRKTGTLPFTPSPSPLLAPQDKDNKVCLFLKIINGWWLALMDDTRGEKTPPDMIDHCTDRSIHIRLRVQTTRLVSTKTQNTDDRLPAGRIKGNLLASACELKG